MAMTLGRPWGMGDRDRLGMSTMDPFSRSSMIDPYFRGSSMLDPWGSSIMDPFDEFALMSRRPAFGPVIPREISNVANARVDWVETPDAHLFKADLPGLRKEDITIEVTDDNLLSISGERSKEEVDETDWYRHVERSYGRFYRRFRLPDDAKPNEVTAKMEHGVLTVEVPKHEDRRTPMVRQVQITD